MSKKWYNYIVSVDDAAGTESNTAECPAKYQERSGHCQERGAERG